MSSNDEVNPFPALALNLLGLDAPTSPSVSAAQFSPPSRLSVAARCSPAPGSSPFSFLPLNSPVALSSVPLSAALDSPSGRGRGSLSLTLSGSGSFFAGGSFSTILSTASSQSSSQSFADDSCAFSDAAYSDVASSPHSSSVSDHDLLSPFEDELGPEPSERLLQRGSNYHDFDDHTFRAGSEPSFTSLPSDPAAGASAGPAEQAPPAFFPGPMTGFVSPYSGYNFGGMGGFTSVQGIGIAASDAPSAAAASAAHPPPSHAAPAALAAAASAPAAAPASGSSRSRSRSSSGSSRKSKAPPKPERLKKPTPSFLLFSQEFRAKIQSEHNITNKEVSKILGERWRNLTPDEKNVYVQRAAKLKADFHLAHPNYQFQRSKKKHSKRRKLADGEEAPGADEEGSQQAAASNAAAVSSSAAAAAAAAATTTAVAPVAVAKPSRSRKRPAHPPAPAPQNAPVYQQQPHLQPPHPQHHRFVQFDYSNDVSVCGSGSGSGGLPSPGHCGAEAYAAVPPSSAPLHLAAGPQASEQHQQPAAFGFGDQARPELTPAVADFAQSLRFFPAKAFQFSQGAAVPAQHDRARLHQLLSGVSKLSPEDSSVLFNALLRSQLPFAQAAAAQASANVNASAPAPPGVSDYLLTTAHAHALQDVKPESESSSALGFESAPGFSCSVAASTAPAPSFTDSFKLSFFRSSDEIDIGLPPTA